MRIKINRPGHKKHGKRKSKHKPRPELMGFKIAEFIRANLERNLSTAMVAKKFHMYEKCVSRSLCRATGLVYSDFILAERMKRIKVMIYENELTLEEIARRSGYRNYKTFTDHFNKYFNVLPSVYRANLKPKIGNPPRRSRWTRLRQDPLQDV